MYYTHSNSHSFIYLTHTRTAYDNYHYFVYFANAFYNFFVCVFVTFILKCRSFNNADDLNADEFFKQNRMILSKAVRTSICIDPQFKAIECIKTAHQRQNNVKFLRFDGDDSISELLKAIALGEIIVFEDVHTHIDPILMDLLEIKLLSWFTISFYLLFFSLLLSHTKRNGYLQLRLLVKYQFANDKWDLHRIFSTKYAYNRISNIVWLKYHKHFDPKKMSMTIFTSWFCRYVVPKASILFCVCALLQFFSHSMQKKNTISNEYWFFFLYFFFIVSHSYRKRQQAICKSRQLNGNRI